MSGAIRRNTIVARFGQPATTAGSVNDPRERDELGLRFNEKWVYRRPVNDPVDAAERAIFWHRYDYVGSAVRSNPNGAWLRDDDLPRRLSAEP
jgi:hypothetical protein